MDDKFSSYWEASKRHSELSKNILKQWIFDLDLDYKSSWDNSQLTNILDKYYIKYN